MDIYIDLREIKDVEMLWENISDLLLASIESIQQLLDYLQKQKGYLTLIFLYTENHTLIDYELLKKKAKRLKKAKILIEKQERVY